MGAVLLTARWVFPDGERRLDGGGVVVAGGCIARILTGRSAVVRFSRRTGVRPRDLGNCILAPGFVDAHAHLELTALEGRLSGQGSFATWIRALIRERAALSPRDLSASACRGADRLIAGGTTCVGDVDSGGAAESALRHHPVRVRLYREVLDAGDPARASAALQRANRPFARSARLFPGLSPHAPYTVGAELFAAVGALAARRRWPACVHWAETEEEVEWLARERGPLRGLLSRQPGSISIRRTGLEAIAGAGLLASHLALVHGNHPSKGDVERVARAKAVLVHCPGTHTFFGRKPFDLRRWLDAGVTVALGTDGLASNPDLDMRREMSLLREAHPWLSPETTFDMATRAGARALGFEGRAGELAPGAWADLCAHRIEGASAGEWSRPGALLDALTRGRSKIASVWISGRAVRRGRPEIPRGISESSGRSAE
jgi:cytosine/adenosine deaminase-related metal-dependent hydrolase